MRRTLLLAALLGGVGTLAILATACSSGSDEPAATSAAATAEVHDEDADGELADAAVGQSLKVEMQDFAFAPAAMTVKAGDVIEIAFTNEGTVTHDFTIERADMDWMMSGETDMVAGHTGDDHEAGMAMHVPLEGGHDAMTRMRVHEPGEYVFYCTVAGHRELGMEGKLTVQ
ncbi:MAG: plastocyanin/azurin family copper-binding protein [Chloroflexi bacterium]|nr:plastocyanin/azurin family copper-binding protein [Chloroflexota bacterium]MDA1002766.1 plastocyanin/azurin family copper-binding protein [Chloroflexota bacterium]